MKFLTQYSPPVKLSFVFQNAPSTRPEADLQSPEVLAEIISERESLEANILTGLTAGIEARRAAGRVPEQSIIDLSDLLKVEDTKSPEDFKTEFNQIWSQVPEEIRASIIATASTVDTAAVTPEETEVTAEKAEEIITQIEAIIEDGEDLTIDFNGGRVGMRDLLENISDSNVQEIFNILEAAIPNMQWLKSQPEAVRAQLAANSNYINTGIKERDDILSILKTALGDETDPARVTEIIEQTLNNLPASVPTAANAAIQNGDALALVNGVADSMQTMFASEYKAWSAAMQAPGATLQSFNDYLVAQAGGDQGKLSTMALKIQLAGFIDMIKPFLDMFKSMTGQTEAEEDPDAPTEEEQRIAAQREAGISADRAEGITDEAELQRRADYREAALYLNSRDVVIKNAMGEDGEIDPELLTNLPGAAEVQNPTELKVIVDQLSAKEWGRQVLTVGLSLDSLNDLRHINVVDDVTVTGSSPDLMLSIGGDEVADLSDEDNRDSLIQGAALSYVESAPARQAEAAEAAEAAEQAAENLESRNAFVRNVASMISTQALAEGWSQNAYIDAYGENGFYKSGDTLMVDMDDDRGLGIDWGGNNLELFDMNEYPFAENGYSSEAQMITDLATVFKDKKIRQFADPAAFVTSID